MPHPALTPMRPAARRPAAAIVTLCALLAIAASPTPRHDFESFRARMENPTRAQWQKPEEVVNALGLRPGQRVAAIGPPRAMRLSAEQVMDELRRGGFRVTPGQDFFPLQYMLTAEPETVPPAAASVERNPPRPNGS